VGLFRGSDRHKSAERTRCMVVGMLLRSILKASGTESPQPFRCHGGGDARQSAPQAVAAGHAHENAADGRRVPAAGARMEKTPGNVRWPP